MKTISYLAVCVVACALVCAKAEEKAAGGVALALTVSPEVPETVRAGRTPYSWPHTLRVRDDLDPAIRKREIAYTWSWIKKPLGHGFGVDIGINDMLALSDIGPRGDDGFFLKWRQDGYTFEMLDSRALTLVIQKPGLEARDVMNVFTTMTDYACVAIPNLVRVTSVETGRTQGGASYGQITVDRGDALGWFTEPIGWYKEGDALLLVFEKVLPVPTSTKMPYTVKNAAQFVGGAAWADKRPFLRFEESNRQQIAEEYFLNVILPNQPKPGPVDNSVIHGRPLGAGDAK